MSFSSSSAENSSCSKKVLVVIPARFASTRLPGKMMTDIAGEPLIVHTWRSVMSSAAVADLSDVIVACDDQRISDAIKKVGGEVVLTDPDLPSGTDRVFAAYKSCDNNGQYEAVINVQGDMPFVEAEIVTEAINLIQNYSEYDMSTVATKTDATREQMYEQTQVVNPVISFRKDDGNVGKALYFSRSPLPFGGPFYKHIGVYGFRPDTLERFVKLPQSPLEKSERLEQLRAIEDGMTVGIKVIDLKYPISVDTAEDLENARRVAAQN